MLPQTLGIGYDALKLAKLSWLMVRSLLPYNYGLERMQYCWDICPQHNRFVMHVFIAWKQFFNLSSVTK